MPTTADMTKRTLSELVAAREKAMEKVRGWWDADQLAGRCRDQSKAPAWPEYLAAFDALSKAQAKNDAGKGC